MSSIVTSFNAVAPLFLILVVGYCFRKKGLIDAVLIQKLNRICFLSMISSNIFFSIYNSSLPHSEEIFVSLFCIIGVFIECVAGIWIVSKLESSLARRGGIIQAMYRTNLVLVSLPIATQLYGNDLGSISVTIAILIPLYNILAVVLLEYFRDSGEKTRLSAMLVSMLKNPQVIASLLAFSLLIFHLRLPSAIEQAVRYFSQANTSVALMLTGASLNFGSAKKNQKTLIITLLLRLIIFPFVFLCGAYCLGMRGQELMTILLVFGAPLGTIAYVFAQQMDADADLADEVVVFSTTLSCVTLFLWIFVLKRFGFC